MGSLRDCFDIISESSWGHSGVVLVSTLGHVGVSVGSTRFSFAVWLRIKLAARPDSQKPRISVPNPARIFTTAGSACSSNKGRPSIVDKKLAVASIAGSHKKIYG